MVHYIEDLRPLFNDIQRVLKPGGYALIQSPFKSGKIKEAKNDSTAEDRLKQFGDESLFRIYSIKALKKRLEKVGFSVESKDLKDMPEELQGYLGLPPEETMLFCEKNS